MKKLLSYLLISLCLVGCQAKPKADEVRVGTITGPETELMTVAQAVAMEQHGLNVKIVEFNDYTMPNTALAEGSIDANMFQHIPYLKNAMALHHYDFVVVAKTFIYPMGLYSKKITALNQLPVKAIVAIPNDPTNEARALLLLQKAKLITLNAKDPYLALPENIVSNPKQLQIKEIDAADLPRALDDVSLAAINTNYAILANLTPSKNALFVEDANSPYANVLVVRKADANNPKIKQLIQALHSKAVVAKAKQLFHNEAVVAW